MELAIDFYEEKQKGLGKRLFNEIENAFNLLTKNPFFQIRYDDIRCLPLKKFPFMIHYRIEGSEVLIFAILHTSLNPEENYPKT